ncbi:hypothetical protein AB6G16_07385 [Proteus mirabilis]
MHNVTLSFKYSHHISQYIYGFLLLSKNNIIKLSNIDKDTNITGAQHILRANIDGKKIIYDANDGDHIDRGFFSIPDYEWCDLYFKRSYSNQLAEQFPKCRPLGFNYEIKPFYGMIDCFFGNIRRLMGKEIIKHTDLEIIPNVSNNPKILFLTRLWEPNPIKDNASKIELEYYNETIQLNKVRMDALNMIHTQFNEKSTIGINDIPYSRRMAPDFILPKEKTHRRNFINMMKEHEICITSTGLHKSTGWRFGEFVAASRAIISEPLNYVVPGNFDNYLPFNNIEELYLAIEKLVNDKELRYDMMKRNNIYYNNYLKPDRLILNTITSL